MRDESSTLPQSSTRRLSRSTFSAFDETSDSARISRFIIVLFAANVISAVLFIGLVNRPVYDDPYNIFDVHNYATRGLSVGTLLSQRNPPGPTSFLWMAAGVRLLGGDELRDARIANLMSWLLLGAGVLIGAKYSGSPQLWYGALLVLLVFPHTLEATATILTELAVTCRQYYLALLPAAALFAFYQWRRLASQEKFRWLAGVILSLVLTAIPVILLVLVWKGISSPGMATGTSYNHAWKATVGRNLSRPIVVAFYVSAYLLPFTFPAMFQLKASQRRIGLLVAVLGGIGVTYFSSLFLQPGPLNSLIRMASRLPYGGTVLFAVIAIGVIYNAASVCCLLWEQRHSLSSRAPVVFAIFAVAFFIVEQFGVGGNLPFYDRYVLQIAPFLGLIAFTILPRVTPSRLTALACLSLLSHGMLWRFAFGP